MDSDLEIEKKNYLNIFSGFFLPETMQQDSFGVETQINELASVHHGLQTRS